MTIQLYEIPSNIKKPGIYAENNTRNANNALPQYATKLLLIGQKINDATTWTTLTVYAVGAIVHPITPNGHLYFCVTAGTAAAGEPSWTTVQGAEFTDGTVTWKEFSNDSALATPLVVRQIFSEQDAIDYNGSGSLLHRMVRSALSANTNVRLYQIACSDGAGVNATATITITGTATASGSIKVNWEGDDYVESAFVSGDNVTTNATALKAAFAAKPTCPFVVKNTAGVLTLTCKNRGVLGNSYILTITYTPNAGVTVVGSAFANGTVDPDIHATSGVIDSIKAEKYDIVVTPYNDATSLGYIETYIDFVSSATEGKPGHIIYGYVGSIANGHTLADATQNGRIVHVQLKASPDPSWIISSAVASKEAGLVAAYTPVKGKQMQCSNLAAPVSILDRFTRTEIETCLSEGITPLEVTSDGKVQVVRMISTDHTDVAWYDITNSKCLDRTRKALTDSFVSKYSDANINSETLSAINSNNIAVCKLLEAEGTLRNIDLFKGDFLTEQDSTDYSAIRCVVPVPVAVGLMIVKLRLDLRLS